jgi:hypothetical protein
MKNVLRDILGRFLATGSGEPAGTPSSSKVLDFTMQTQTQTLWCWAATAVSVSRFLNSSSTWTQCKVANEALHLSTCCNGGASDECDTVGFLEKALEIVDNFERTEDRRVGLAELKQEIDLGRPLCLRVQWPNGSGHFVAIYGYDNDVLHISDPYPYYRTSKLEYDDFPRRYQKRRATWTDTYWVKQRVS